MKLLHAGVLAFLPLRVLAQTSGATARHEVNVSASSYTYVELRSRISIRAANTQA
jgi:hypothetical protein